MKVGLMRLLSKMEQEGNYKKFDYKEYECLILRPRPFLSGHLCGYVKLKETDKNYNLAKKDAYDLDYEVHGGITFGGTPTIRGLPVKETGYWIGFDCAHAFDLQPMNNIIYEELSLPNEIYRDMEYVVQECRNLVDQILEEGNNYIK